MANSQPHDFKQFVSELNARRDAAGGQNWTLDKLRDGRVLDAIGAHLAKYGIVSFPQDTLGDGHMALVFPWHRHQVIRIADNTTERPRFNDARILQPIASLGMVEGFGIEVLPRVTTLQNAMRKGMVSKEEASFVIKRLVASFARSGLFFWDCKIDNICIMQNERGQLVPLVLDSGAVSPMREMYQGKIGNDEHTNMDKFKINLKQTLQCFGENTDVIERYPEGYLTYLQHTMPELQEDFAGIQKRHAANLGLRHGFVHIPAIVYYGVVEPKRQQIALAQ